MGIEAWLSPLPRMQTDATLAEVNKRLSAGSVSITVEDARMLSARREEALSNSERTEFGQPAIVGIAEAVATSPYLSHGGIASVLADLQDAFYALRDELSIDVPDAEIAEALRGCLDAWGDASMIASMPTEEVMSFSAEYARAAEARGFDAYRIADDEGRTYTFDPTRAEWDYDEHADGWDGDGWADGWDG